MMDFKPIKIQDKELYEKLLFEGKERGCEYSFANLFLWGRQKIAIIQDNIVLFSQFNRRTVYPLPLGDGDKKAVISQLIEDSEQRGISLRITGLDEEEMNCPNCGTHLEFEFECDCGCDCDCDCDCEE